MYTVYVIKSNGKHLEEKFVGAQEAINYSKESSLRSLCSFMSEGDKMITYEYGEQVKNKTRLADLYAMTEEIENNKNEFYAKDGRGKACKRKV